MMSPISSAIRNPLWLLIVICTLASVRLMTIPRGASRGDLLLIRSMPSACTARPWRARRAYRYRRRASARRQGAAHRRPISLVAGLRGPAARVARAVVTVSRAAVHCPQPRCVRPWRGGRRAVRGAGACLVAHRAGGLRVMVGSHAATSLAPAPAGDPAGTADRAAPTDRRHHWAGGVPEDERLDPRAGRHALSRYLGGHGTAGAGAGRAGGAHPRGVSRRDAARAATDRRSGPPGRALRGAAALRAGTRLGQLQRAGHRPLRGGLARCRWCRRAQSLRTRSRWGPPLRGAGHATGAALPTAALASPGLRPAPQRLVPAGRRHPRGGVERAVPLPRRAPGHHRRAGLARAGQR